MGSFNWIFSWRKIPVVRISRRNLLVGSLVWIFSGRKVPGRQLFNFLAEGTYSRESGESGESTDSASSFPAKKIVSRIAHKDIWLLHALSFGAEKYCHTRLQFGFWIQAELWWEPEWDLRSNLTNLPPNHPDPQSSGSNLDSESKLSYHIASHWLCGAPPPLVLKHFRTLCPDPSYFEHDLPPSKLLVLKIMRTPLLA